MTQQPLSRRHHFLPKFYLKGWKDSSGSNSETGVWITKRNGKSVQVDVDDDLFLRFEANTLVSKDGSKTDKIERLLGKVENVMARTLRGAIRSGNPLSAEPQDAMLMFLASLKARVPSAQNLLREGYEARNRIVRESYMAQGKPVPDEGLVPIENIGPFATLESLMAIMDVLEKMSQMILVSPNHKSFITSDRPVVGYASTELLLPLSPKFLLVLFWGGAKPFEYVKGTENDVDQINRRTASNCDQWIVTQKEVLSAVDFWRKDEPLFNM